MEQYSLTSRFLESVTVPSNLTFTVAPAPDLQALTINFDNTEVEIQAARRSLAGRIINQTAIQTKVVTLHIPYSTDQPSLVIRLSLRGTVNYPTTATGVHVRLVACAGDTTKVVNLPLDTSGEFVEVFEFTVQPRAAEPVCQITLFLLVEHDIDTEGAGQVVLVIDSLDLEMNLDSGMPDTGTFKV